MSGINDKKTKNGFYCGKTNIWMQIQVRKRKNLSSYWKNQKHGCEYKEEFIVILKIKEIIHDR